MVPSCCLPFPGAARLALSTALVALALLAAACADGTTAPPAPVVVPSPQAKITGETRSFTAGPDTLWLDQWETSHGDCGTEFEFRARLVDALGTARVARSLYAKHSGALGECPMDTTYHGWSPEYKPLLDFLPHRNTRELINLELYELNALNPRIFSQVWYVSSDFSTSGVSTRQDGAEWGIELRINRSPVYGLASVSASPASIGTIAGAQSAVELHAYAADAWGQTIEVYNQALGSWQSSDSAVAGVSSTATYKASQYGSAWSFAVNSVTGKRAGTATISASYGGRTVSIPITVKPAVTVSGDTYVDMEGDYTYTASVVGCNATCTFAWSKANQSTPSQFYTVPGSGSSVVIPIDYGTPDFILRSTVTSNGQTVNKDTYVAVRIVDPNGGCGTGACEE